MSPLIKPEREQPLQQWHVWVQEVRKTVWAKSPEDAREKCLRRGLSVDRVDSAPAIH